MNILGINGWGDWFHDPAACLLINGELVALAEEERFTRQKHAPNTSPVRATKWCLESACLEWSDIDYIGIGWDLLYFGERSYPKLNKRQLTECLLADLGSTVNFPNERVIFVRHHVAHAYSSLVLKPSEQSLIVVLDGQGEENSITIFRYKNNKIYEIASYDSRYSLGYYYEGASAYVGFGLTGTGKLMGLSSYGIPTSPFWDTNSGQFLSPVPMPYANNSNENMDDSVEIVDEFWTPEFRTAYPGLNRNNIHEPAHISKRNQLHKNKSAVNFSASVQQDIERLTYNLIQQHIADEDKNIIISGGVALNCKNNGSLLRAFRNRCIKVQPLSHDAGCSLGAAIHVAKKLEINTLRFPAFPYIGPIFSNEYIKQALIQSNLKFKYVQYPEILAAELISTDNVIGWYQGRAEVGPRALGARSILARPDSIKIRDRINHKIKRRELWRPFAPAIIKEFAEHLYCDCTESNFMLFGFPINDEESYHWFKGTIHVDGTSRVQTVTEGVTPEIFLKLVWHFYQLTGIPGVLNTSFNGPEEPIVNTPMEAISTFIRTKLDALIIGNYFVNRSS